MKAKFAWTKLQPQADPEGGVAPLPRSSHGVSLVQNGSRLIIFGGEHVARTPVDRDQACWALDIAEGSSTSPRWRRISMEGGPSDRIAHAQAAHDDRFVYVFAGRAGIKMDERALDDLWVLDCSGAPGAETWSQVEVRGGERPEARSFHRMICLGDALYVFGGCGASHGRLADLHKFDLASKTWRNLKTPSLRGRGGPNLLAIDNGTKLAVVAGFAGEETKDGDRFDLAAAEWEGMQLTAQLVEMRPRSVCVAASFPTHGVSLIFGGEVDPSDKGHEGAGGFTNDICVLSETDASYQESVSSPEDNAEMPWPEARGWADAAALDGPTGHFYVFGGLTGDDENPRRLDDLWCLNITSL